VFEKDFLTQRGAKVNAKVRKELADVFGDIFATFIREVGEAAEA
jgi:hypothetical protein